MKSAWISSLTRDQELLQRLLGTLRKYGLETGGHFWTDDLQRVAWQASLEEIINQKPDMWIIAGSAEDFAVESVRYGVSLVALGIQARRGLGFPIMFVNTGKELLPSQLTTPLQNADILDFNNPALGAKVIARANTPSSKNENVFRLDLYAHQTIGLWYEIGPREGEWNGILFGSHQGTIDAHGVGPAGQLPHKSVLEFQMRGLKLTSGEQDYEAWAVRNTLTPDLSYYVRVRDIAKSVIFGPFLEDDSLDVHRIDLV